MRIVEEGFEVLVPKRPEGIVVGHVIGMRVILRIVRGDNVFLFPVAVVFALLVGHQKIRQRAIGVEHERRVDVVVLPVDADVAPLVIAAHHDRRFDARLHQQIGIRGRNLVTDPDPGLEEAVGKAKEYISGALAAMLDLGKGSGPMQHNFDLTGKFA